MPRPSPIVFGSGPPQPSSAAPIPHSTPPTRISFGQSPQTPPPSATARISFGRPHPAPTHSATEHFPPPAPIFFGQPPHAPPRSSVNVSTHPTPARISFGRPPPVSISLPARHSTTPALVCFGRPPRALPTHSTTPISSGVPLSSQPTPPTPPPHRHRPAAVSPEHESIAQSIYFPVVSPASQSEWTLREKAIIAGRLQHHDPDAEFPPFTPEGAEILNRFTSCQQWLLRASAELLSPEQEASIRQSDPQNLAYRTTPTWDLYRTLYKVATGIYPGCDEIVPHPREVGAAEGAHGEITACLESSMTCFKALFRRHQILTQAVKDYDSIIADVERNLM